MCWGSWWGDAAKQTAGFGWLVGGCGGGRGSGQECGSGDSYWPAGGQEVVAAFVTVEVRQNGWSHIVLLWRLESDFWAQMAWCHRHWRKKRKQEVAVKVMAYSAFQPKCLISTLMCTCIYEGTCQHEAFCRGTDLQTDYVLSSLCWWAAHGAPLQTHTHTHTQSSITTWENTKNCITFLQWGFVFFSFLSIMT